VQAKRPNFSARRSAMPRRAAGESKKIDSDPYFPKQDHAAPAWLAAAGHWLNLSFTKISL
jgi:hypothetical protein